MLKTLVSGPWPGSSGLIGCERSIVGDQIPPRNEAQRLGGVVGKVTNGLLLLYEAGNPMDQPITYPVTTPQWLRDTGKIIEQVVLGQICAMQLR